MTARAGSAAWLLRHEVRLFLYGLASTGKARHGLGRLNVAIWAGAALVLHLFAFFTLRALDMGPAPPQPVVIAVSGLLAAAMMMMLSTGLKSSVEVLFERGDLDLLLSSPLSSRSIFTVRLAGIVTGIAGLYLFFLTPFAHAGLILGQPRWLGIYPAIVSAAALTASLAMLTTLGLVRALGVRRTRVVAQVLGALSGALFFLLSQLFTNVLGARQEQVLAWLAPLLAPGALFGPGSLAWFPGRAILGAPGPLVLLSLLALAGFLLTVGFTHRAFVRGVQQAVSTVRVARPAPGELRFRFRRSLARVIVIKEWRLIARDPQLISQVLLQLLYLLPLCVLLFANGGASLPGLGAGLAFLCGSLAAALAWIIISAEDAPDLLLAAPCSAAAVRRAKLVAVAIPPLAIVALPLSWALVRDPLAGVLMSMTVTGSISTTALIVLWRARPVVRSAFRTRAKADFLSNTFEVLNGFAWAALAFLTVSGGAGAARSTPMLLGAAVAFAAALLILALAWVCRRNRF